MDYDLINNKHLLIIAGVHKGATTSMYHYLSAHKDICIGRKKELHYYTPIRYGKTINSLDSYLNYFTDCKTQKYYLDASPSYIYGKKEIAFKIRNDFRNVKIIIILRDPVDRFISFYKSLKATYRINKNEQLKSFIEKSYSLKDKNDKDDIYYRGFREGCYSNYLGDWINLYENSVKIIFFDDINIKPFCVMKELCKWLNLDYSIYENKKMYRTINKTIYSKSKTIHRAASTVNRIFEYFFREHPNLKRLLYTIYIKINVSHSYEAINKEDINYLKYLYENEYRNLRFLLKSSGYNKLPNWLLENTHET